MPESMWYNIRIPTFPKQFFNSIRVLYRVWRNTPSFRHGECQERLLHIARQMHLWIFLNCADEQKAYDELKITAEENVVFGYGGKLEITMPEPPKEEV